MSDGTHVLNRRAFLAALGTSAAATVLGTPRIVEAAPGSADAPRIEYEVAIVGQALLEVPRRGASGRNAAPERLDASIVLANMSPTPLCLKAPAGHLCRATIRCAETEPDALRCWITGLSSHNDLGEIQIDAIGEIQRNAFGGPFDASVFNTDDCWVPFDYEISPTRPLILDFRALGDVDRHLLFTIIRTIGFTIIPTSIPTPIPTPGQFWDVRMGPFSGDDW